MSLLDSKLLSTTTRTEATNGAGRSDMDYDAAKGNEAILTRRSGMSNIDKAIAEIRKESGARRDNASGDDRSYEVGTANGMIQAINILRRHFAEPPTVADAVEQRPLKPDAELFDFWRKIASDKDYPSHGKSHMSHGALQAVFREMDKRIRNAVAAEREACVRMVLRALNEDDTWESEPIDRVLQRIAAAIRARSTQPAVPADAPVSEPTPIAMRLSCPSCGELHIDEGEFATKSHHTHSCQHCGMTWRPAVVKTVGVQFLPGFKD